MTKKQLIKAFDRSANSAILLGKKDEKGYKTGTFRLAEVVTFIVKN